MVLQKADTFAVLPGEKAVFSFADIAQQARDMLDKARAEADRLVQQAGRQADGIRQQAREQGMQEGLAEGRIAGQKQGYDQALEEGRQEFQTVNQAIHQQLNAVCTELNDRKEAILWQAEQDTIKLALQLARKVIHRHLTQAPETTVDILKHALQLLSGNTDMVVHLNPQDVQRTEQLAQTDAYLSNIAHLTFTSDDAVAPGGCIVHTVDGSVDADIQTQLDLLSQALLAPPADDAPDTTEEGD